MQKWTVFDIILDYNLNTQHLEHHREMEGLKENLLHFMEELELAIQQLNWRKSLLDMLYGQHVLTPLESYITSW